MTKRVSNREAGNIWAGWLLSRLAENWPLNMNFEYNEIIEATGVSIVEERKEYAAVLNLIEWLYREGYVNYEMIHYNAGLVERLSLTNKSMSILSISIESLGGRGLGDAMIEAASDIGKESAKSTIADLFGQFIGGIAKSVSS